MTPERKSNPLDVKVEIMNQRDWKNNKELDVKVKGTFRNAGWRVKEQSHKVLGEVIEIDIKAEHSGGFAAMVLTPFEVTVKIQLEDHLL